MLSLYTVLLSILPLALAKTDLSGCTSSETVVYGGASLIWYVPGTGEICEFLDCGGGAGAPITTQPGCPLYSGTASYTPSYLPGYGSGSTPMATPTVSAGGHGGSSSDFGSGSEGASGSGSGSGSRMTTLPNSTGSSMAAGSTSVTHVVTSAPLGTGVGSMTTVLTKGSSANVTVTTPSASSTAFSGDADVLSARVIGKEVVVVLAAVVGVIAFL